MDDADTVNNIMLSFVSMPYVLVLDPTVHMYYIPDMPPTDLDAVSLAQFLGDVKTGKLQVNVLSLS